MSRKLAIAISGAVSLGSYESGIMYEVLEAIARYNYNLAKEHPQYNKELEETHPDNERLLKEHPDRIEIDVITGASARQM